MDNIRLGTYLATGDNADDQGPTVLCEAKELRFHVGKPWLMAYLARQTGLPITGKRSAENHPGRVAEATPEMLARHMVVCGATGSGKTRLALHLMTEQLRQGCSAVVLDPKLETLRHLLFCARRAGLKPAQVSILTPTAHGIGSPGWNPLDTTGTGLPFTMAVADFVSVLALSSSTWGPRLADLLTNALIIIGAHKLSLFELARFLQREDYREGLLAQPLDLNRLHPADQVALQEAREYFIAEFGTWGRGEQGSAIAPVLNKIRDLLRMPFLRALLCARESTLDLSALWQQQRVILVHLDRTTLGDEGARLLGGLLSWQLYRTAMRTDGPKPVVLSLDEMGVAEKFIGKAVSEILAIARSRKLRLLVACQHLAQLSEELRTALLANTAVQAFFRLGHADAKVVAASLAAGAGESVSRISLDEIPRKKAKGGEEDEEPAYETTQMAHTVLDAEGNPLRLSEAAWAVFRELTRFPHERPRSYLADLRDSTVEKLPARLPPPDLSKLPPASPLSESTWWNDGHPGLTALKRFAALSGIPRLYVHAADSGEPVELRRYAGELDVDELCFTGPAPVQMVVRFPRPKVTVLERSSESSRQQGWIRTLQELPVQQAVVRLAPGGAGMVRVVPVADLTEGPEADGLERFFSEALVRNGQSEPEIARSYRDRQEGVDRVAGGGIAILESTDIREEDPPARTSGIPRERRTAKKPTRTQSRDRRGVPGKEPAIAGNARSALPPAPRPVGEVTEDGSIV